MESLLMSMVHIQTLYKLQETIAYDPRKGSSRLDG